MGRARKISEELTRIRVSFCIAVLVIGILGSGVLSVNAQEVIIERLSPQEIQQIGEMVFKNECASKDENLIAWNEGENFMSLGIGHFIWHPANMKDSFEESFAKYIEYAKSSGEKVPAWLDSAPFPACPWNSRIEFLNAQSDGRLAELKEFLVRTKPMQAAFIVKRLQESLPLMLKSAVESTRDKIAMQFNRVASTAPGVFALADYVNFKEFGIASGENYQGKGWGLFQVLARMRGATEAPDALGEFIRSANLVLEERVQNSPLSRNEQRWLPGWQQRINSYINKEEKVCLQD